ncbi:demethoxyubiquinone hydroxylase family protein [Dokdonella sp. MW10]|uniref:demethoxyubiquinone hydroxylase family protein n=1 Tax=Dokdonella sp. MW10 TaxID=2992926 RepID=UPI003F804BAF
MKRPLGDRILKVNHAGEHGAICIYSGQIAMARWTAPDVVGQLREFREHEQRHHAIFAAELERRGCRRCRSYMLCGFGGWFLGLATGMLGRKAIAATTAAVEEVVLRHLEQQIRDLGTSDPPAVEAIESIIDEEQAHHDHGAAQLNHGDAWQKILKPIVSSATETVIWLGMRL